MRFEQEQAVKAFVKKFRFRLALWTTAICVPEILLGFYIYILSCFQVLGGILLFFIEEMTKINHHMPETEPTDSFITPLTVVLGCVSFCVIPSILFFRTRRIETFIENHRRVQKWLANPPDGLFPIHFHLLKANYLRFALTRSVIAGAPSLIGFVILYIHPFSALNPTWVDFAAISMMVWALVLKVTVIPTAGRLEKYMIEKLANEPNPDDPPRDQISER